MAGTTLLNAVTSTQTGPQTSIQSTALLSSTGKTIFQVTSQGGTGTCTAVLEGSIDNIGWVPLAEISVTAATGAVSDGVYVELLWLFLRARATAVGSGASVTATVFRAGA